VQKNGSRENQPFDLAGFHCVAFSLWLRLNTDYLKIYVFGEHANGAAVGLDVNAFSEYRYVDPL